jgi:GrpB-like predicted nucleotidyltransferase (UPF0157 family)
MPAPPGRANAQPMTDEQIRAAVVGELREHDAPVTLAEYDLRWPELFAREEARICAALGDRVMLLEHIGSTSVAGLAAKPVIDMILVVADSGDEAEYLPALEAAGYTLRIREPDWHQHRLFNGPDTAVGLHVFSRGSPEIPRHLAFRGRLRSDPADRELYERTKRELAARRWKYVQNYADAKSTVIDKIMARAAREEHVGRDSGPGPRNAARL